MLPEGLNNAQFTQDHRNINAGVTGTLVKAGHTEVYMITITNTDSKNVYVKFYDKATAGASTDTPVHTYPIPAGWIQPIQFMDPDFYVLGMSYRATGALADNDTTAPTASTCIVNIHYK